MRGKADGRAGNDEEARPAEGACPAARCSQKAGATPSPGSERDTGRDGQRRHREDVDRVAGGDVADRRPAGRAGQLDGGRDARRARHRTGEEPARRGQPGPAGPDPWRARQRRGVPGRPGLGVAEANRAGAGTDPAQRREGVARRTADRRAGLAARHAHRAPTCRQWRRGHVEPAVQAHGRLDAGRRGQAGHHRLQADLRRLRAGRQGRRRHRGCRADRAAEAQGRGRRRGRLPGWPVGQAGRAGGGPARQRRVGGVGGSSSSASGCGTRPSRSATPVRWRGTG